MSELEAHSLYDLGFETAPSIPFETLLECCVAIPKDSALRSSHPWSLMAHMQSVPQCNPTAPGKNFSHLPSLSASPAEQSGFPTFFFKLMME